MKHCPACNFTFPDFHRVCDFDGTELVQDPERQALMRVPKRFPHPRRSLKKPMLLTSLAVLGLFLSAVFIGYLESPTPYIPAIVKNQEVQNSPRLTHVARPTSQSDHVKKKTEPSKRTGSRSVRVAVSSTARLRQRSIADSRSRNDVIERTRDSKLTSAEKSPKIVAILKTTWKVLKKPFDF
jgi:hypothetical protein